MNLSTLGAIRTLSTAAALFLALPACEPPPAPSAESGRQAAGDDRPNILLIVAEDMSARVGAFGDELAQTPTIDALAEDGIRFPNTFTVSGVCAPSRSSLITGIYTISMGTHQMRTSQGG